MLGLYRDNGNRNGNHGILVGQINVYWGLDGVSREWPLHHIAA